MSDSPYREMKVASGYFHFLGELAGSGLSVLQEELAKILTLEGNTRAAYLSKVQYLNEDKIRAGLIIDGLAPAQEMAQVIATHCQPLVEIDLFFFETLSNPEIEHIKSTFTPFFTAQSS